MGEYVHNKFRTQIPGDRYMSEIALRIEALTSTYHDGSTQAPDQLASMAKKEAPRLPPADRAS